MTAVVHPAPALLREVAARLAGDCEARPGLADVRRHIAAYLLGRLDIGTLAADDLARAAMADLEAYQLHRPAPATVGDLVDQLRAAADWREQLEASGPGGAS